MLNKIKQPIRKTGIDIFYYSNSAVKTIGSGFFVFARLT
jgi:hypothetical protein